MAGDINKMYAVPGGLLAATIAYYKIASGNIPDLSNGTTKNLEQALMEYTPKSPCIMHLTPWENGITVITSPTGASGQKDIVIDFQSILPGVTEGTIVPIGFFAQFDPDGNTKSCIRCASGLFPQEMGYIPGISSLSLSSIVPGGATRVSSSNAEVKIACNCENVTSSGNGFIYSMVASSYFRARYNSTQQTLTFSSLNASYPLILSGSQIVNPSSFIEILYYIK